MQTFKENIKREGNVNGFLQYSTLIFSTSLNKYVNVAIISIIHSVCE